MGILILDCRDLKGHLKICVIIGRGDLTCSLEHENILLVEIHIQQKSFSSGNIQRPKVMK